jgi:glucose/arabinose dehydrogenase
MGLKNLTVMFFPTVFYCFILNSSFVAKVFLVIALASVTMFLPPTVQPVEGQVIVNDPKLKAELVFQGLDFPTSMAFLKTNDILITEKDNGTIQRITDGKIAERPLGDVSVASNGERGLLGIAVNEVERGGKKLTYVFLYYTESATGNDGDDIAKQEEPLGNRIYRYEFEDGELKNGKLLLDLPANPPPGQSSNASPFHNGGEILVGPDDNVYAVIGDLNSRRTQGQNIDDGPEPDGTSMIYRITQSGGAVEGNPFEDIEGFDKYYAYGIRNSFGMDFDPETGKLWDTENGPDYGDEINLVEPGFNSGALRLYGMSTKETFDPNSLVEFEGLGKYSDPEFVWEMPIGVTSLQFLDSDKYSENYKNDLFIGDINNGNVYRFELNDERDGLSLRNELEDKTASTVEELDDLIFARGFGGITDLEVGPDGFLYVLTINRFHADNVGSIYRVIPTSG